MIYDKSHSSSQERESELVFGALGLNRKEKKQVEVHTPAMLNEMNGAMYRVASNCLFS